MQFILVGAVYNNALTNCATRVCCACLDEIACVAVMYLTLRTVCERHGRKNPLPFPFSKRSHVGNLRQTIQGKGRSSKRKENRRLSFLFAPAAGRGTFPPSADGESPAEVQRKTLRPERANTLTQFACPAQSMQKRSRPLGANTLTQFVCPGFPVQKIREVSKKFSLPKRQKIARSHAEKTPIRMTKLAKPNRTESGRKFLSKKCLTYWLGYANLYTWLAEAY